MEKTNQSVKRQADRRAGQLGLAASAGEKAEPCLDPEVLADLAAGVITPEKRQEAMAHFSNCQKCYDAWVAICFSIAAAERTSRPARQRLLSNKNLAYLGSAFAVAASIAVFLNIGTPPELVEQETGAVQEKPLRERAAPAVQADGQVKSAPAPTATAKQLEPQRQEKAAGGEARFERAAEPAMTREQAAEGAALMDAESTAPDDGGFAAWLAAIDEACRRQETSPAEWRALATRGRDIPPDRLSTAEAERLLVLRSALAGIVQEREAGPVCRAIIIPALAQPEASE